MVMDIIVILIFILSVFFSMHRGFTLTVINFVKCIAAILLAFLFSDNLRDFLLESTPVGPWFSEKVKTGVIDSVTVSWSDSDFYHMLPSLFQNQADKLTESLANDGAEKIAAVLLGIFSFFLIVLMVNLAAFLLSHLFSRKHTGGCIGFMDWLLGGVMGVAVGAVYVFLFLALILPITGVIVPNLADNISHWFESSYFAGDLYDNNLLLIIFRDLLN